jgi:UDP-4-amino-4,6-dideoxy-N-acetyl-beta-L-altrosamine transaminase
MTEKYLPYSKQEIDDEDIHRVINVLKSDWLTTGPNVEQFENEFKKYIDVDHAVAVSSGTSGLDIAVQSLGIKKGEVITTPFTFAATTNCILFNHLKPIYADIKPDTFNIDPNEIRKKITKKTKAIIYVDYAGQPCDIDEIREIAENFNLYLIEDAAHALGGKYQNKKVGSFADITMFSFHPVKHVTTGEGGMCTTNNEEIAETMKMLRNHGIDKDAISRHGAEAGYEYNIKYLARNYRLTDFQCVLGSSQLKKLEKSITKRKKIAFEYNEALSDIGIERPTVKPNVRHAWHLYTILLNRQNRDKIFREMRKKNIGVNVHYIPTYKFSYYQKILKINPKEFPVTEEVFSKIMSIPMYPSLSLADIEYVVKTLREIIT